MSQTFILDTPDNVRRLNQSLERRQEIAARAEEWATERILTIKNNQELSDSKRDEIFAGWGVVAITFSIQLVRTGQATVNFPDNPFNDRFMDWLMSIDTPLSPLNLYSMVVEAGYMGDYIFGAIERGELVIPSILNDLAELKSTQSESLRQVIKDLAARCGPNTEIPVFDEGETLERLTDSLATPIIRKRAWAFDPRDAAKSFALQAMWKGTDKLLRGSALEHFRRAFAGNELQGYLRKAVKRRLQYEQREALKDKNKREREGFEEIPEANIPSQYTGLSKKGIDEDGKKEISPIARLPYVPTEDIELVTDCLLRALNLSADENKILTLKLKGMKKVEIAKIMNMSRPTLNTRFKDIQERARHLDFNQLDVYHFREDTYKMRPAEKIHDPTPYSALIQSWQEEINNLTI